MTQAHGGADFTHRIESAPSAEGADLLGSILVLNSTPRVDGRT
jgi:hypothetical protein